MRQTAVPCLLCIQEALAFTSPDIAHRHTQQCLHLAEYLTEKANREEEKGVLELAGHSNFKDSLYVAYMFLLNIFYKKKKKVCSTHVCEYTY